MSYKQDVMMQWFPKKTAFPLCMLAVQDEALGKHNC